MPKVLEHELDGKIGRRGHHRRREMVLPAAKGAMDRYPTWERNGRSVGELNSELSPQSLPPVFVEMDRLVDMVGGKRVGPFSDKPDDRRPAFGIDRRESVQDVLHRLWLHLAAKPAPELFDERRGSLLEEPHVGQCRDVVEIGEGRRQTRD